MTTAITPLIKISQIPQLTTENFPTSDKIWFVIVDAEKMKTRRVSFSQLQDYLRKSVDNYVDHFTLNAAGGLRFTNTTIPDTPTKRTIKLGSVYTITDAITNDLASTANTKATNAQTTADSALAKSKIAYDTAILANTKITNHIGSRTEHPVVTTTANGFMTFSDKIALDTLVASGTGAPTVTGKIKIVTGEGLSGGSSIPGTDFTLSAISSTTTRKGIVQLNDDLTSSATDQAATANVAKRLNDLISQGITINTGSGLTGGKPNSKTFDLSVALNDTLTSTSKTHAATANSVNALFNMIGGLPIITENCIKFPTSLVGGGATGYIIEWGRVPMGSYDTDNTNASITNITLKNRQNNIISCFVSVDNGSAGIYNNTNADANDPQYVLTSSFYDYSSTSKIEVHAHRVTGDSGSTKIANHYLSYLVIGTYV